jgi:1,4-alpha-glucan branching enzyme
MTPDDLAKLQEGLHDKLYEQLGAHVVTRDGVDGVQFAVWAPAAETVAVIGDFNGWDPTTDLMGRREDSGLWERFIPEAGAGSMYKFHVVSRYHGHTADKSDPFGFHHETPSRTASVVCTLDYSWNDQDWMERRAGGLDRPMSTYEVHLGSWMRNADGDHLGYREAGRKLAAYAVETGFTHVELLPVMEHPFYGSWGYQVTGYFAPSSRFGSPSDFMALVDELHQAGIGVILDWVPSHFPSDGHGLAFFDGTHLFEHADPRQGFHPDWKTYIYNYGSGWVRSFLISSALFWMDHYHVDGLRVDAVASMLYLDYSRDEGQWVPNRHGGRENLEAVKFLKDVNTIVYRRFPGAHMIAEESTSWPMVTRPVDSGGLGFGMKWDMGWMNDTLEYMEMDPVHRRFHHNKLTFRMMYAWSENFTLSLSHDEVVHGKRSLLDKMPGNREEKAANLRLLFGYMFAMPGKKLVFMGCEFGQWKEWNHDAALDWELLDDPLHAGIRNWYGDLNRLYAAEKALHREEWDPGRFRWIDCNDEEQSVLTLLRSGGEDESAVLVALNFTPVIRRDHRVGVPSSGAWQEVLNSDAEIYGGGGEGNLGLVQAENNPYNDMEHSVLLTLPPMSALFLKHQES